MRLHYFIELPLKIIISANASHLKNEKNDATTRAAISRKTGVRCAGEMILRGGYSEAATSPERHPRWFAGEKATGRVGGWRMFAFNHFYRGSLPAEPPEIS